MSGFSKGNKETSGCPQQFAANRCLSSPRILQEKLDQPVSAPPSPRDVSMEIDSPENMMRHIRFLKNEVERLKKSLRTTELQREWPLLLY